jgi:hypothetical protein
MVDSAEQYNLFVDIKRGSAMAAQTRSLWDTALDRLNDAIKEYRRNCTSVICTDLGMSSENQSDERYFIRQDI